MLWFTSGLLVGMIVGYLVRKSAHPKPKKAQEEPSPKQWKLVGDMKYRTRIIKDNGLFAGYHHEHRALLFMTDDGERKVKWVDDNEYSRNNHPATLDALAWSEGGNFPEDFEPIMDPLGTMLQKLIDMKLEGEKQ